MIDSFTFLKDSNRVPQSFSNVLRSARIPVLWVAGIVLFALFIIWNRDLHTFLTYLTLGLPQGAIIALIAVGYSMVYGIIQLINFAHGEVFMFSTYFAVMLLTPVAASDMAGAQVITVCVGAMAACAAWVGLSNWIRKGLPRLAVSVAIGLGVAALNYMIIPRASQSGVIGGVPFFVAALIAVLYSCCLGVTMDLAAYRPLRNSPRLIPLITAIGLSLFLQNFAQAVWGSASRDFPRIAKPETLTSRPFVWAEWTDAAGVLRRLSTTYLDLLIIVVAIILMLALQGFIHFTRTGKAMRACAQDRTTASLMGVQVNRVVALAFAVGAGLAAIAAPLYVLRGTFINPTMGYIVGILAFASAVLGGIGNITGAMLGGLIIGIIYTFVPLFDTLDDFHFYRTLVEWGWVTDQNWNNVMSKIGQPGQYQLGVAYAFMILVIVLKPTGLLGKASAKRA